MLTESQVHVVLLQEKEIVMTLLELQLVSAVGMSESTLLLFKLCPLPFVRFEFDKLGRLVGPDVTQ